MTAQRRKLIEVSLPLEAINAEAAREKSIRHGHPSTLHLWWARRPLAAARAVLFAQLVDDPSSDEAVYLAQATEQGLVGQAAEEFVSRTVVAERERLHQLIRDLVKWDNSTDEKLLRRAHEEILRCTDGNPPAILDPFAGGGTIPLEAQRLGLEAHASDLNPVAVLINKALIEIPPIFAGHPPVFQGAAVSRLGDWPRATGLAEDVRRYGAWMRDEAQKRIGHLYPKATLPDGSSATVIAWIWARTITCPNPACGIRLPLVRSWWLGKKKGKEAYVVPHVSSGTVTFTIGHDLNRAPIPVDDGTVGRTGATCIGCGSAVPLTFVRAEGRAKRMGQQLMAVVAEGQRRRVYLAPTADHETAADLGMPDGVPDGELGHDPRAITAPNYGMTHFADLFTPRQITALTTFSDLVGEARTRVLADALASGLPDGDRLEAGGTGAAAYADAIATYLGFALSKLIARCNTMCTWETGMDRLRGSFQRQAIPMSWDYAEALPLQTAGGGFSAVLESEAEVLDVLTAGPIRGTARQQSATFSRPDLLLSTDPPYYDNIGYADLSDFFYVWLRRSLHDVHPGLLSTMLVPKAEELVANPYRHGGKDHARDFFESGFTEVFANARASASPDFPITVYYAFKQSESDLGGVASTGWETLLDGMVRSGWSITGTWPLRSELGSRMRNIDSNALASSIVLALRPRPESAEAITRRGFLAALKAELPESLRELQQGAIAPVDLAQAAIGPGMAVFSRYSRVVEADGSAMTVRTALALINHALDEVLTEQEGDFDADTRFCVKWFTEFSWTEQDYGKAEQLVMRYNTSVEGLKRGGVLHSGGGRVRLIEPNALAKGWDPLADERVSVWEATVRVAAALMHEGTDRAAVLMAGTAQRVDLDAVRELAYLLYSVCEKTGRSQDALLFNALGSEWADLSQAARGAVSSATTQMGFDLDDDV